MVTERKRIHFISLGCPKNRVDTEVMVGVANSAGCDLAVVTTQPGSVSQQNVTREGFALLYARAVLVRS